MAPAKADRTFYVIVRNENDEHWTSHSDFLNGKFFPSHASALSYLTSLNPAPPESPLTTTTPTAVARPMPTARTCSTSSASTVASDSSASSVTDGQGVRFEVRKIAARSLCGSWTWWFVDDASSSAGGARVGGATS